MAVLGALGGWQFVKYVSNWRTERKNAGAESEEKELGVLRKHIDWLEKRYNSLSEKVDDLYKQVRELENEKIELMGKNKELEMALKESRYNECRRPDDECLRRYPQREICLAKKLLGGYYDKDDGLPEESDKGGDA